MGKTPIKFADDGPKPAPAALAPRTSTAVSPPSSTRAPALRQQADKLARASSQRQRGTFRSLLGTLAFAYLAFSALVTCRYDAGREHAVCRAFDELTEERARAIAFMRGHAQPYLDRASASLEPYVAPVRPHVERASALARPVLSRAQRSFDSTVQPALTGAYHQAERLTRPSRELASERYRTDVDPHVQRYSKLGRNLYAANVDPHVQLLSTQAGDAYERAQELMRPAYERALPAAQHAYAKMLVPAATTSYATSRDVYRKHVYPGVRTLAKTSLRLWRTRAMPMIGRFYSLYIQPPLDRVREKVFEHRAKSAGSDAAAGVKEEIKRVREEEKLDDLDGASTCPLRRALMQPDFIADLKSTVIEYEEPETAESDATPTLETPAEVQQREAVQAEAASAKAAELEAATRERRTKVEKLLDTYSADIEKLGAAEGRLLVERLNSLRRAASSDIPARFEPRVRSLTTDGDRMIAKLDKYFERTARDARTPTEQKVADADDLTLKALARLHSRADDIVDELDEYGQAYWQKEANAVNGASTPLMDLVFSAQREVGDGLTWLADVEVRDWTRYHTFGDTEKRWLDHYRGLMNGTVTDPSLGFGNPFDTLAQLKARVEGAANAFEDRLEETRDVGVKRLEGRFVSVGESVRNAAAAARGAVVGEAEVVPEAEGVAASASSLYARATDAASEAFASAEPGLVERASSSLHEATRSASRAVGLKPTPEAVGEHIESATSVVTENVASAYAAAQSRAAEALRQAQDVLGLDLDVGDLVSSVTAAVTNAPASVSSVASVAGNVVESVASSVSSVASDASASVSSYAGEVVGGVSDVPSAASASYKSATRAASRAVGATPSPDGAAESMEALYEAASRAASSIANAASANVDAATDAVKTAVGATPSPLTDRVASSASSLADQASSSLHSVTRVIASAVGATPSPEGLGEHVSSVTEAVRQRVNIEL